MGHTRSVYNPLLKGWVTLRDVTSQVIERVDCRTGGAQEAFDAKCAELKAQGWTLEERKYDWRYAHRGGVRILVTIETEAPAEMLSTPKSGGGAAV